MERLTVGEAAERLEISEQAVRKRVQRGTLPHGKQDGRVYVYLDAETSAVGEESSLESDNQTTLNYVDKLYSTLQALYASEKRVTVLLVAASVLLLAFSGGAVAPEEKLRFAGVGLRVPLAVLMVTGVVLIPIFLRTALSLNALTKFYETELRTLYKSLGLAHSAMNSPIHPYMNATALNVVGLGFREKAPTSEGEKAPTSEGEKAPAAAPTLEVRGAGLLAIVLFTTLPAAAQVGTGYKVSELLGKAGKEGLATKVPDLLDKVEMGWLSEALSYVHIGDAIAYLLAVPLPQQGSDWVSDLFVALAYATSLLWLPEIIDDERAAREDRAASEAGAIDAKKARRNSLWRIVGTYCALLFFVWIGTWLGYLVGTG